MAEELKPHEGAAGVTLIEGAAYVPVEATPHDQGGFQIFIFVCPKCRKKQGRYALGKQHDNCGEPGRPTCIDLRLKEDM